MKRNIAEDRVMCEALEIDRWVSVESRTEYGGDDSWIEVTLTGDDTTTIGGNAVYEIGKALLDYLDLCETQQERIKELEGQLESVISEAMRRTAFGTTTTCPPTIRNRFHICPYGGRPVVAECHKCWDKWSKEVEGIE